MNTIDVSPRHRFSLNLAETVSVGARLALSKPRSAASLARIVRNLNARERIRSRREAEGLVVPPLAIISLTRQCNLHCASCYAHATHGDGTEEMTPSDMAQLLQDAEGLGISTVLLAGGEPLMRQDLLDVAASRPDTLFVVFTNGTLLDSRAIAFFRANPNIIPVISLEGDATETDERRGAGTHASVEEAMRTLKAAQVLFGASVTVTTENLALASSDAFVSELVEKGVDVLFHVEYVPQGDTDEAISLDAVQKAFLAERAGLLQNKHRALVVAFPGDETEYGGCLAAGRGFLHVSADGNLTPCPFTSVSDTNVRTAGLEAALRSPLLRVVRNHHHELQETKGGCALARNRGLMEKWLEAEKDPMPT